MGHFTPTCENDGDYSVIQRHASTGYSWCVDTKTGKTIDGTKTRSENPDCKKDVKGRNLILGRHEVETGKCEKRSYL